MITVPDSPAPGSTHWTDLGYELNRWEEEGRTATLWWRDDDAVAPSRRLDDLLTVAGAVPVSLAVIPANAEPALAGWLERHASPSVRVLQHGYRHANHASAVKKSEFPNSRPRETVKTDLALGRARLAELFGPRALAVLAPPWNRFDDSFLPLLAEIGIRGISKIKARFSAYPEPGVFEANVHVDLVSWRTDRGFVGEAAALGGLVAHLRARRSGNADPDEPTGLLTHHLVQDEASSTFLARLISLTRNHPAARWLDADAVFASADAKSATRGQA
ncbi:MAG: polysaccharide deacetylase family protein [Alphaproteobacteria bacterium]|nr:polysaccharide deacetylase family protein [Alphaproteobacteria bacterium]